MDSVCGIRSKGIPLLGKPPAASVFEFDPAFRPESPAAQRYLSKVFRSMETEYVELLEPMIFYVSVNHGRRP